MNRLAKYTTKGILGVAGLSATLLKYDLKATDVFMGGALNMADSFAPNSLGTPIKDMAVKISSDALEQAEKVLANARKRVR